MNATVVRLESAAGGEPAGGRVHWRDRAARGAWPSPRPARSRFRPRTRTSRRTTRRERTSRTSRCRAPGFPASTPMFIEQCDGVAPSATGWDPTVDCDLGSVAGARDVGRQRQRHVLGDRPRIAGSGRSRVRARSRTSTASGPPRPTRTTGLPSYTNCQIRVSSNNSAATDRPGVPDDHAPEPLGAGGSDRGEGALRLDDYDHRVDDGHVHARFDPRLAGHEQHGDVHVEQQVA